MAEIIQASPHQSLAEIRQWEIDFTNDLPTLPANVVVSSATATHIPPSGAASNPVVGNIANNVVPTQLGPLTVVGLHILAVLASYSNGEKSEIRAQIKVDY
jgi:hypothetical protein